MTSTSRIRSAARALRGAVTACAGAEMCGAMMMMCRMTFASPGRRSI